MPRYGRKRRKKKHAGNKKGNPREQVRSQQHNKTADEDWVRLDLTATLLEDAHLGSGAGGAGIDALVARDRDGKPVIWASHLKGLLRDAARRAGDAAAADSLFGRSGGQRQRILLTSLYATTDPASRIWRSTARSSYENRAPRDDTLRVIEYVPKGTKFEGAVELPKCDREALERLVLEIDAVGRGRATGAGRVRLVVFEAKEKPHQIGRATERLRLLLQNLDPLCITATATPDNLVPSMSFVPGRTLLGALAAWLIEAGDRQAAALLTGARVSVSDALPLPEAPECLTDIEVLPAPLTLQREKVAGTKGPIPWWAQEEEPLRRLDLWCVSDEDTNAKLKRPEPDLFVYRSGKDTPWQAYRPVTRVRLRNGRPNPSQADPDLFAVEQIAERTPFLCEICGNPALMKKLAKALAPVLEGRRWLRLGRGGVPVEVRRTAWTQSATSVEDPPERAYLILTSDLLVRDENLRWLSSMNALGFQRLPDWPDDVTIRREFQDSVPVYGFNGTARLRRLPALAVRRGSIYKVEGAGVSRLGELVRQRRWLGERTHEGFGHFAIYPVDALPGISGAIEGPVSPARVADDPAEEAAERTRRWFEEHRALSKVGMKDSKGQRPPSLSQWYDLVSDLQRGNSSALDLRQNPTKLGARTWEHVDAKKILKKLDDLRPPRRADYARMFVQWLRADMKDKTVRR
jgi:hypothetical protein